MSENGSGADRSAQEEGSPQPAGAGLRFVEPRGLFHAPHGAGLHDHGAGGRRGGRRHGKNEKQQAGAFHRLTL